MLTIGELAKGIARLSRTDARAAVALSGWFHDLHETFSDRLLPIDTAVATRWGDINAVRTLPVIDSLIAATASVHGLIVATRNVGDFEPAGVRVFDPWTGHKSR